MDPLNLILAALALGSRAPERGVYKSLYRQLQSQLISKFFDKSSISLLLTNYEVDYSNYAQPLKLLLKNSGFEADEEILELASIIVLTAIGSQLADNELREALGGTFGDLIGGASVGALAGVITGGVVTGIASGIFGAVGMGPGIGAVYLAAVTGYFGRLAGDITTDAPPPRDKKKGK